MLEHPDFLLRLLENPHCIGRPSSEVVDTGASAMLRLQSFQVVIQGQEGNLKGEGGRADRNVSYAVKIGQKRKEIGQTEPQALG